MVGADAVTPDVIKSYQRDGAVVIRNLLTPEEVATLTAGITHNLNHLTRNAIVASGPDDPGHFVEDFRIYPRIAEYVRVVEASAVGEAAVKLMGCTHARFHHDHLLVKEPLTVQETPWHQDLPYYNITGNHNVSFWIPVDPVAQEDSLKFLAGTHQTGQMYLPRTFLTHEARWWPEGSLPELSELWSQSHTANASLHTLQWDVHPGDAIAFHMRTVHSAGGAPHRSRRRRAYSIRLVGDDARFAARPWRTSPPFDELASELVDGAVLDHPLFPIVWPRRQWDTSGERASRGVSRL
eukprot:m.223545 g.223545  ORF g.223545 m.223545 type:complete len:295 (-) comp33734_c0_seq1:77-961(-)